MKPVNLRDTPWVREHLTSEERQAFRDFARNTGAWLSLYADKRHGPFGAKLTLKGIPTISVIAPDLPELLRRLIEQVDGVTA